MTWKQGNNTLFSVKLSPKLIDSPNDQVYNCTKKFGSTIQQLKKKEKENWETTMFHFDKNPCGNGEKKMSQISACGIHETATRNISRSLWENGRDNFLHVVSHAEPISPKRYSEVKDRCRTVRLRLMPQDHQLVMLVASVMT